MKFACFFRLLQDELIRELPANADIRMHDERTDKKLILIHTPADLFAPLIPLQKFYNDFLDGSPIHEITDRILNIYSSETLYPLYMPEDFQNRREFEAGLRLRPASLEMNRRFLPGLSYIIVYDMLFFITVRTVNDRGSHLGDSPVTEELLRAFAFNVDSAAAAAISNMQKTSPAMIDPLESFLKSVKTGHHDLQQRLKSSSGDQNREKLFVLTNKQHENGACTILYPGLASDLWKRFGEYYLLPSSVHELLVFPKKNTANPMKLRSLIRSVNESLCDSLLLLSDNLYAFEPENGLHIS